LLWVYYSACILFFGAEFTKVYACRFGSGIIPNHRAMLWSEAVRAQLLITPR
jgi:membrane protein